MKHIFVINPAAGRQSAYDDVCSRLSSGVFGADYEIYRTRHPHDATSFIRSYCEAHPTEDVRFYACGGDGTLNEVVSGVVGHPNASVGCYPCGSGNDFVKYYGGADRFLDLSAQASAEEHLIDLIRVGDRYAVNAAHFQATRLLGLQTRNSAAYKGVMALVFREKNLRAKALDLVLVLLGMFFLYLGSR